ncbi:hypothetical protein BDZ91DRAFT_785554 [Kalaharituber pfeilii]|nr:hypothetical protein BDZ91DRAFT_785554 [Kalaharituber pfeilii]
MGQVYNMISGGSLAELGISPKPSNGAYSQKEGVAEKRDRESDEFKIAITGLSTAIGDTYTETVDAYQGMARFQESQGKLKEASGTLDFVVKWRKQINKDHPMVYLALCAQARGDSVISGRDAGYEQENGQGPSGGERTPGSEGTGGGPVGEHAGMGKGHTVIEL